MKKILQKLQSVKIQFAAFLVLFAVYLAWKDEEPVFLLMMLLAIVSCLLFEAVFSYWREKKWSVSSSAWITGCILGDVLSADQPWWIFPVAAFLAIVSKFLIRVNKKHLFNPAAFGTFFVIVALGATTQWKGTYLWYVLAPFGFYFVYKFRKLELLASYGVVALALFAARALSQKVPLGDIFGYLSYFFIFIMLIEPKTTPIKPLGKMIFGGGVAVLIFILTEAGVKFDAELGALLIFNLTVPFLNKMPTLKGVKS